ncbi:DUF732 domain-containing protein [Mycolicibacterium stellerae]|uniref:DUF732 domain-containing protein n=1 Tax=Mycolicibacterium stellerae TaxID=2358193 RepID=UPI0013DDDBC7|nr:DUF732 domain-containing protein [Mycolicibacterium stellerae]
MKSATMTAFAALWLVASPTASADSDDDAFLKTLEAGGFSWSGDGQPLVDLGHDICGELDSGMSAADIIAQGAAETGWTQTQVGYFLGAAASEFCPGYLQQAVEEAKTLEG